MYPHLGLSILFFFIFIFFMRYLTNCIKIGRWRQLLTKCLYVSVILVFIYYYSIIILNWLFFLYFQLIQVPCTEIKSKYISFPAHSHLSTANTRPTCVGTWNKKAAVLVEQVAPSLTLRKSLKSEQHAKYVKYYGISLSTSFTFSSLMTGTVRWINVWDCGDSLVSPWPSWTRWTLPLVCYLTRGCRWRAFHANPLPSPTGS